MPPIVMKLSASVFGILLKSTGIVALYDAGGKAPHGSQIMPFLSELFAAQLTKD